MVRFYILWKRQQTLGFLTFSRGFRELNIRLRWVDIKSLIISVIDYSINLITCLPIYETVFDVTVVACLFVLLNIRKTPKVFIVTTKNVFFNLIVLSKDFEMVMGSWNE